MQKAKPENEVERQKQSRRRKPDESVQATLDTWLSVIHVIGQRVLGPLWLTLFESIQDAVVLGLLFQIPGSLYKWTAGASFPGLDVCWIDHNVWSTSRYACFTVVLSDYAVWAVLVPRVLFRVFRDIKKLLIEKRQ